MNSVEILGTERKTYIAENWQVKDVPHIARVEADNWAPWLRKPPECFSTIVNSFPDTQLLLKDSSGIPVATITTVRMQWDGRSESLLTWDDVAGGGVHKSDYTNTYDHNGNTICLMAANVDKRFRRGGIATKLIGVMQGLAKEKGITHLISSFRPSGFGEYKLKTGDDNFSQYCAMTTPEGEPIDPWLRSVARKGMTPLRVEDASMVVDVPIPTFNQYQKEYKPEKWKEVERNKWECGETGSWYIQGATARYIEPNLWGEIPISG